jgi:NTP pyrophosphatase (non-canonical NTP hydrolase)
VQRNKEWDADNQITGLFRILEFAGEVGELCNVVKKLERERMGLPGSRATLIDFTKELADCQITLDLLAMHYSIDLAEATRLKFNEVSEKLGWQTKIEPENKSPFYVCNDCSTTEMCTQEEHCDRLFNGYR